MKFVLIIASLFNILVGSKPRWSSDQPVQETHPLVLKLSASKSIVHGSQDKIEMTLEFQNVSKRDVYIGSEIAGFRNAPSMVFLIVKNGQKEKFTCGTMNITLSRQAIDHWWTKIAPAHYYGTRFGIDSQTCEGFGTAGDYTLTAQYVSKGGQISINSDSPDQRVEAWSGKLESNEIQLAFLDK